MRHALTALALSVSLAACSGGGNSPTSPSPAPTTPTPPPAPQTYTITGVVTVGSTSQTISGATVQITDGPQAGASATTDGSGRYTITGLSFAGMSGAATAPGYTTHARGIALTSGVTSTTINWQLLPAQLWSRSGTGDQVLDMPAYVSRVRVQADFAGFSSNFIVYVAGRLLVNELLGRGWPSTHFDGTYLTTGGTVEIRNSSGVSWSLVEVR